MLRGCWHTKTNAIEKKCNKKKKITEETKIPIPPNTFNTNYEKC